MPRFSANWNGNREEHKVLAHNTHASKQTGNEIKLQNGERFAQHADCCGNREEHKVLAHYNTYANRHALRKQHRTPMVNIVYL